MSDLAQGNSANLILNPGDAYRVSASGVATVVGIYGAPTTTTTVAAASTSFGPYNAQAKIRVTGFGFIYASNYARQQRFPNWSG
jgi:hypothetical protein